MTLPRHYDEELGAYFGGSLPGDMGLRSWLGPWGDRQSPVGSVSSAAPPEPDAGALAAARVIRRIESTLGALTRRQALVLQAYYTPVGPYAPLRTTPLGDVAGVALVLGPEVHALLDADLVARVRLGLRARSACTARDALESLPLPGRPPFTVQARLQALAAATGRDGKRTLRRVATVARRALGGAHQAYYAAAEDLRSRRREERRARRHGRLGT